MAQSMSPSVPLTCTPLASAAPIKRLLARHPLLAYFVLAFACSWLITLPALVSQNGFGLLPFAVPFAPLQTLGAFGPLLAAFVVTAAADGRAGIHLLRRIVRWRVGLTWYLLALGGYLLFDLLVGLLVPTTGVVGAFLDKWPLLFTLYLPALLIYELLNGPIGEETGWSGCALPRLQTQFGPLLGATILGVAWAAWHLPAYFVVDGLGSFSPIGFVVSVFAAVVTRILWTWVYNRTGGSVLIAILLHAASDTNDLEVRQQILPPAPPEVGLVVLGLYLVAVVLLLAFTRGKLGAPVAAATNAAHYRSLAVHS
jgi:membrane protease YdiL (CAAX protease family)